MGGENSDMRKANEYMKKEGHESDEFPYESKGETRRLLLFPSLCRSITVKIRVDYLNHCFNIERLVEVKVDLRRRRLRISQQIVVADIHKVQVGLRRKPLVELTQLSLK